MPEIIQMPTTTVHQSREMLVALALLALAASSRAAAAPPYTPSPIIGVLTVPFSSDTSCISVGDHGDAAASRRRSPRQSR